MNVKVLRPGLLTTVQDYGRHGMQRFGVPVGGAMDAWSFTIANHLVGNDAGAAALEITLVGPELEFERGMMVALCGGDLAATINNHPMPMDRPVWIDRGARLAFGESIVGCRAYLAFGGGIDVALVMGSRSTYLRTGFGGLLGRALRAGDELPVAAVVSPPCAGLRHAPGIEQRGFAATTWSARTDSGRMRARPQTIRFVAARHWELLKPEARAAFLNENFRIGAASDRMGFRLEGIAIDNPDSGSVNSGAVTFGTIQLPPDGKPIVLMADRQTIGGYPRLGEVASADLRLLAQLRPGDSLMFERIALAEAQQRLHAQQTALAQQGASIKARLLQEKL